jgi:nitroimidazol reductase NimA-like FMN-containing flavoprotein (pyridoxamine 5'-phosphate oxidase superfamily)
MTEPTPEFHVGFSEPAASAVPWADVERVLATAEIFWLSTVRPDGRPHVTPLPLVWDAGLLHICTGDQEQKAANLRRNPHCVLTTGTNRLHDGLDVVVEGHATRITDHDRLVELAALWKSRHDWDYRVGEDTYDDGVGHIGLVYAVRPEKAFAFGKKPHSQTRYRFPLE